MTEVEPVPSLSVIDDCKYSYSFLFFSSLGSKKNSHYALVEQIANKELQPTDQEIIETKCVHWNITNWSQLDNRTLGPVMQAGGHDW